MNRSVAHTAAFVALLLKRSDKNLVRLRAKTIKRLAKRTRLHEPFFSKVRNKLLDLGYILFEIDRGTFVVTTVSELERAPTALASTYIPASDRQKLSLEDILRELNLSEDDEEGYTEDDDEDED